MLRYNNRILLNNSILLAVASRGLLIPSGLVLPFVLNFNGKPFEWLAVFYLSIAASVLGRAGFDRRKFRFISRFGFPLVTVFLSVSASIITILFFSPNYLYLSLAAYIPLALLLSIFLRSRANFFVANLFDVPGLGMTLALSAFLPDIWVFFLFTMLCFLSVLYVFNFSVVCNDWKKSSTLRCVFPRSAVNASAGFIAQSIIASCLSALVIDQIAFNYRMAERVAFSTTFLNSCTLVIIQYMATKKDGILIISRIGRANLFSGIIILGFLSLGALLFDLSFDVRLVILFGFLHVSTMLFPPVGLAGDQLGFSRRIFFFNTAFIALVLFSSAFGFFIIAICLSIIMIGVERAIVFFGVRMRD